MQKRIIYKTEVGVAVLVPSPNTALTIGEVAAKDTPAGVPYKIVDVADIPADRTFRDAWQADFSNPDGYGIGHEAWFAQQAAKEQV